MPPEKNCPPFRVGFSVRVRVSFRVAGATRQLPRRKIDLWLGLGVGLRLVLGLMGEGGQFSSGAIVLEPFNRNESLLNLSYEGIVGIYFEKFRKKKVTTFCLAETPHIMVSSILRRAQSIFERIIKNFF